MADDPVDLLRDHLFPVWPFGCPEGDSIKSVMEQSSVDLGRKVAMIADLSH